MKQNESTTTASISIINVPLGKDGKKLINAKGANVPETNDRQLDFFKNFYKPLEELDTGK